MLNNEIVDSFYKTLLRDMGKAVKVIVAQVANRQAIRTFTQVHKAYVHY